MRKISFIPLLAILLCFVVSSCEDKYGDQLRDLGKRVEILEDSLIPALNRQIKDLQTLVYEIENNGFITEIIQNANGSYTLTFNDSSIVTIQDGKTPNMTITVKEYDGVYYWWIVEDNKGDWLYDSDGNKVRAGGKNGEDGNTPIFKIGSDGCWEYFYDNNVDTPQWIKTGVKANGENGNPDHFISVVPCDIHENCVKVLTTDWYDYLHFKLKE